MTCDEALQKLQAASPVQFKGEERAKFVPSALDALVTKRGIHQSYSPPRLSRRYCVFSKGTTRSG